MRPTGRKYRTKLEVLRDVLATAHEETNKTRIIRLANLNPSSFERYVRFCVDAGLVESKGNHYRNTDSGETAVGAIDRVLSKAEELGFAVQELKSVIGPEKSGPARASPTLRFASAVAWNELLQSGAKSGGFKVEFVGSAFAGHGPSTVPGSSARPRLPGKGLPAPPQPGPSGRGFRSPTRRPLRIRQK